MEAFLNTFGQHLGSVVNLLTMKRIDTGDRMLDSTLQMLLSTLTSAIISLLIALYTKRMWAEAWNWCLVHCARAEPNPMRFDPAMAPEKPLNGSIFMYRADVPAGRYPYVLSWFYIHHGDKKYAQQKLTKNLRVPCMEHRSDLMDRDDYSVVEAGDSSIPSNVWLPVWRSREGDFVYMSQVGGVAFRVDGMCFLSDSFKALRECMVHVEAHEKKMDAHQHEKNKQETKPLLGEIDSKGSVCGWLEINQRKTFDTLFFTQKEEVVAMLTAFKAGTLFGAHLPIDHKLGFLLHGPPGTGKTGFIAAVANFLKRNIISVDMSRVRTRKMLDDILSRDAKKYIFVFEEFDCMPGVARREPQAMKEDPTQPQGPMAPGPYAMMLMAEKEQSKGMMEDYKAEMEAARDKIDLGYLLRKLDGLESGEGRIIIATTNHPERIDPALLRPGRFGLQIHLTRCTRKMLADIVAMIYQLDAAKKAEVVRCVAKVPDGRWSPAEVLQMGVTLPTVTEMVAALNREREEREELEEGEIRE